MQKQKFTCNPGNETMKIYIASSWKNEIELKQIAQILRNKGHMVDLFCETTNSRTAFHWSCFVEKEEDLIKYDATSFIKEEKVQKAFIQDKAWLDWAECCILVLPSGRSAHLEAGYAKGQGKKLYILGGFEKGEFDVMYGFADILTDNINDIIQDMKIER